MKNRKRLLVFLPLFLLGLYAASGVYTLQSGQHAVILSWGKVVEEVVTPGIHYHFPAPIEYLKQAHISNVQTVSINENRYGMQERFTGDENLVIVKALISYDIKDLNQYLFSCQDIKTTIKAAGQMIINMELAKITVDESMTSGKALLKLTTKNKIQTLLDSLKTGIRVISVELTDISPPSPVNSAFKAVADARIKKQEIIKDAEGYANSIIPKSRGAAATIIQQVNAYANEIVNRAVSRTSAFNSLLVEYLKNPDIIKHQKFIEMLDYISKNMTATINSNSGQNTYYIPSSGTPVKKRDETR